MSGVFFTTFAPSCFVFILLITNKMTDFCLFWRVCAFFACAGPPACGCAWHYSRRITPRTMLRLRMSLLGMLNGG